MVYGRDSYHSLPLLPHRLRLFGYPLILLSLGASYLYFLGGRPVIFEVPVFAVLTSYAEIRWFVFAQTNSLDEIAVIFAVIGLLIIAFSKEPMESNKVDIVRARAAIYSIYLTAAIWVLLYLTVFGWPSIIASAFIFILLLLNYILLFHLLKRNLKVTKPEKQILETDKSEVL